MLHRLNKNRKIRFKLREDRAILMVCIGIALIFWLLVKLSQTYTTERQVRLNVALPDDKALADAPPNNMKVEVEGTGWNLMFDYFSNPEINLAYDLNETNRLNLNRGQLRSDILEQLYPRDLKIAEVNYDNLTLALEDKVGRKVPVILLQTLEFAPQYQLEEPVTIEPDSIEVTGPASMVRTIDVWPTDSLVLTNLKSSQTRPVPLLDPPREITLSRNEVQARIEVEQFTEKSLFVPLTVMNAPEQDSLRYFPQRVRVTFAVGLSRYNDLTEEDFRLVANLRGVSLAQNRNQVPIRLTQQPPFVRKVQYSPQTAEFFIVKEGATPEVE